MSQFNRDGVAFELKENHKFRGHDGRLTPLTASLFSFPPEASYLTSLTTPRARTAPPTPLPTHPPSGPPSLLPMPHSRYKSLKSPPADLA
jgi:hypothetical protein